MKNEKKLAIAQKLKEAEKTKEAIASEAKAVIEYTELRKKELDQITQSIRDLGDALQVEISVDLDPLLNKLDILKELPESYSQVKELAQKTHDLLSEDKEVSIKGFRDLWEMLVRSNNENTKQNREAFKETLSSIEKFADLQAYIDQLTETLKQGQQPEDFKPVRLVVGGDGVPLKFLQDMPSSRGGGGSSSSGGGGEVTQGTSPWVVEESNRYAVDGDDELIVHQKAAAFGYLDGLNNTVSVAATEDESAALISLIYQYYFNGTTWDRARGDTTNGMDVDVTRLPSDPLGANADAAVDTDTTGTISGKLRGLVKLMVNYLSRFPASLGQKARSASLPVTLSTEDVTALGTLATETTLSGINGKLPDFSGTWGYAAGTNGTVNLSGSKRVLQITAVALEAAGTITINGGDTITIPYGGTDKVSTSITIAPIANLTDPTVVFSSGVDSYFIEYLS